MARALDEATEDGERSMFTRLEWEVLAGDSDELATWLDTERRRLFAATTEAGSG